MSTPQRGDLWRIKWPLLWLVASIAVVALGYFTLRQLNEEARRALVAARNDLAATEALIDKLGEEESTTSIYLDRYATLAAAHVVGPEDRLQLLETMAQLRADLNLFPIQVNIAGQRSFPLPYPASVREPGRPVRLHQSTISLTLPLLHENDLLRLLDALVAEPEQFQVQRCDLRANQRDRSRYVQLGQHFNASCTLDWFTFAIGETAGSP
ncbi:MAG TPA: hypothetical protein VNR18_13955 [Hyphomicrobiales bacterium]|nr:hypothetical protein [Hyphomicrobiales bacterium]